MADPTAFSANAPRLESRASQVAQQALALGASHVRVKLSRDQVARAEVSTTGIRQVRRSFRKLEVALIKIGRAGVFSTTDLSESAVTGALTQTLAELDSLPAELYASADKAPQIDLPPGPFDALKLVDPALAEPDRKRCADTVRALGDIAGASCEERSSAIAVTDGAVSASFAHTTAIVTAHLAHGLTHSWAARHRADLPTIAELKAVLADNVAMLSTDITTPATSGPRTLLVAPEPASQLIEALVSAAHAGDADLPARLTVIAAPWLPGGLASRPFTDDGRATRPTPLIQGGRRRVTLHPGHAPAPGNLRVGLGGRTLARMVGETEAGILVLGWLALRIDPHTRIADLHLIGHVIDNGKRTGVVRSSHLRIGLHDLFTRLVRVGGDPWTHGTVRSPSLVFDGVEVHSSPA